MIREIYFLILFVMIDEIRNFGKQFDVALRFAKNVELPEWSQDVKNIYLCGMGGSSLPGNIVNNIFVDIEIKFIRDYDIPVKNDYSKDFFVIASFSGNTEETLSCLEQIEKVTKNFSLMAHGGKLKTIAEEKNYSFLEIPACKQPRIASWYFFTYWIVVLSQLGKIDLTWFDELQQLSVFLEQETPLLEEQGKILAKKLYQHMPLVYTDETLASLARIWKINFNENSKIQAFRNTYPELNHNEMAGFTTLVTKPYIIHLISKSMHPRNRKRMQIMEEILWDKISFENIEAKGANQLQELFWGYVLGGFTSYYLALEYGIDPMPVDMVEDFKEMLIR